MSKFVGKFRKNHDYSDDYDYQKNFTKEKHRRNENSEVRKKKSQKEYEQFLKDSENYFIKQ